MNLRTIDIDWDIHKMIEAEREGFDEAPYLALRRLLGLADRGAKAPDKELGTQNSPSEIPWTEDLVVVPHGSKARMLYDYGKQKFEGEFLDGLLIVGGKAYKSLSPAANDLAVTRNGSKTSLNGWKYWEVKFPGQETWLRLEDLRNEARDLLRKKVKVNI